MANRGLDSDQLVYSAAQSVKFYEMLYVRTRQSGGSDYDYTYLTNGPGDISVDATQATAMGIDEEQGGHKFLAVGPFLQFSEIQESSDFQITNVTVALGGMRSEDLALFLENQYIDQPLKIWRYWLDEDGRLVGDPVLIFDGRIDKPTITSDPDGSVSIGCSAASQWVDYSRTNGRHTNNSEQNYYYSGDTIFKYAADSIKDLRWGG
jgi:hypothetical protein